MIINAMLWSDNPVFKKKMLRHLCTSHIITQLHDLFRKASYKIATIVCSFVCWLFERKHFKSIWFCVICISFLNWIYIVRFHNSYWSHTVFLFRLFFAIIIKKSTKFRMFYCVTKKCSLFLCLSLSLCLLFVPSCDNI